MLRRARGYKYILMELAVDLAAVAAGLATAYWIRFHSGLIPLRYSWNPSDYVRLYPAAVALWIASLGMTHCYRNHPVVLTFNLARRLFKGSLLAVALVVVVEHFFRVAEYSRLMYPLSLITAIAGLVLGRALLQRIIAHLLRGGIARARVLIVGTGPLARRLLARCRIHPEYGYEVVGLVTERPETIGRTLDGVDVIGCVAELRELIQRHRAHEVFVTHSNLPPEDYLRLALDSEQEVAQVRIVPNMVEMMTGNVYYDELAGIPLFMPKETPLRGWNALTKRLIDLVVSALGLLLSLPFYPLIAWLIRRDSPGPALYRQKRIGLDGREFEIVKFRTMRPDAESNGPVWAARVDDRCTRVGHLLRRWDLDELPQLWNVLKGDMSLVGPRPERPEFVRQFKERYARYMGRVAVRAGLTGWAQVHGLRGDTPIEQRLQFDLYYIENWSYWLDLKILLLTVFRRGVNPTPEAPTQTGAAEAGAVDPPQKETSRLGAGKS
jgi:exopolysaccharide biosynthesis polyprenyl glycosylphosphotransferase